ncbi:MAG: xanthine dehydrogenase family protein molybdopterin-binding subunit [Geminicoccaceae bacterium]
MATEQTDEDGSRDWKGRSLCRREDDRLLRGEGSFTGDAAPADCLLAEFFRSPLACGRITRLDLDEARAIPGIVAVHDAETLGPVGPSSVNPLLPRAEMMPMFGLAHGRIEAVGQPVAVVIGENRNVVLDALETIALETDGVSGGERQREAGRWQSGDVEGAFASAAHIVETVLDHPLVAPSPMEPRACVAGYDGTVLRVRLSTQTPFRCRDDLAAILGLDPSGVHIVNTDVGGAFGGKASIMPEDVVTAACALRLRRTVRWTGSRAEDLLSATRGRGARTCARMAIADDGRILALEAKLDFDLGHWTPYSAFAAPRNAARILPGPYAVDRIDIRLVTHRSDRPAVNIYRGAGRPEAAMLMERLMDRAADATGLDRLAIRRRNLRPAESLPGPTETGERLDSGDYAALLRRLEIDAGLSDLGEELRRRRAVGETVGLGIALFIEPCGQGFETAALTLMPDGHIRAATGTSAQGQGRATATSQIVADRLHIPVVRIEVATASLDDLDDGIGALASRGTAIGGSAMDEVAGRFMLCLREEARALGLDTTGNGRPGDSCAVLEGVAHERARRGLPPLSLSHRYQAPHEAWASGAVAATVRIDGETGEIAVERIHWIDDTGKIINPLLVEGQMRGGLAQGLGCVLMEEILHDTNGQLVTGSLMDYALPRASDMPYEVHIRSKGVPSSANPLGAKGVGEAGCIGIPAALLNAIHDAIGTVGDDALQLPLTSQKIWRALRAGTGNRKLR